MKVIATATFLFDLVGILFLTYGRLDSVRLKIRFRNSRILRPLEVAVSKLDNVHIANNVVIHAGLVLRLLGDCQLFIGEDTYIGPYSHISGTQGSIVIGKKVMIADYVYISTAYHRFEDVTKPVKDQGYVPKGNVIIDDNCWIGAGSFIMPGTRVGKNSVIAANSVVTHDIPPNSVAAGSPARIIRQYSPTEKRWLDQ